MFGFRPDGKRIQKIDPIVAITPYFMPQRVDAQVQSMQHVDCDVLTEYIREQRAKGHNLSYTDLIVAAYVQAVAKYPQLNRFVVNKQLFARNQICISMTVLKNSGELNPDEATFKLDLKPTDTVYDVHEKMEKAVEENRKVSTVNGTDKAVKLLMSIPGLTSGIVNLARLLDRYGLLPKAVCDLSPFHTGMYITNMASLGMTYVYHHIYNFGTTSIFLSIGKVEKVNVVQPDGSVKVRRMLPMGLVIDERIASGCNYGLAFGVWRDLLAKPHLLEKPAEEIAPEMLESLKK